MNLEKRSLFRRAASTVQRLRKFVWRFTGRPAGAHALAFTHGGKLVLVKLTYAEGWRVPGGGVGRNETAERAILRELAEEIGMTRHGRISEIRQPVDRPATGPLFVVSDVEYRPRRSWEIAAVGEFSLDSLPPDLSRRTRAWIERWSASLKTDAAERP